MTAIRFIRQTSPSALKIYNAEVTRGQYKGSSLILTFIYDMLCYGKDLWDVLGCWDGVGPR